MHNELWEGKAMKENFNQAKADQQVLQPHVQGNGARSIGEILCDFFQNSQEPIAVSFRTYATEHPTEISRKILNGPVNSGSHPAEPVRLEDWFDNQDVMHLLHISPRTLRTLRTNGTLPFSRLGNKLYYKRTDIQGLLMDNYTMIKIRNYGKSQ